MNKKERYWIKLVVNLTKLISAITPLKPSQVTNIQTGEILNTEQWSIPVSNILSYVQKETVYLFETQFERFEQHVLNADKLGSLNSFARQRGYASRYKTNLPSNVKAQSRVNELILHKFASETSSYILNPNPQKQSPSFPLKMNLGAVDKQMVVLNILNKTIQLTWKVWDEELLFEFIIPDYILKRSIKKMSLPTIQYHKGELVFIFTVEENTIQRGKGKHTAGVDLGRVEPFTMAIVNQNGERVAHYTTRARLKHLNQKRERLLVEKKHLTRKINTYEKFGLNSNILSTERDHKTRKIKSIGSSLASQIGADITQKIKKHNVSILHVEDLRWVTGVKYGSRWNHSAQQASIQHAVAREGILMKKVNSKNTSQNCYKCGTKIAHNSKTRSVHCIECKTSIDRDFNAAMNIAKNKRYPTMNRVSGDNYSGNSPQVVDNTPNSVIVSTNDTIVSFTT